MSDTELSQVSKAFSDSILSLGTSGSGNEQGTCSMLRTLYEQGSNKIFQNNSYAAFVLISDENDSTALSTCYYRKTWDVLTGSSRSNIQTYGFPMAIDPNDLFSTFVDKANSQFGQKGYFFSAIIHDPIENVKQGCPSLTTNSYYGTKYRELADQITLSNVYSICSTDYSQALKDNIGQFVQELSTNTYKITLANNELIEKVFLIRGGVETELTSGSDYNIRGDNIEFATNFLQTNDKIRVSIKIYN
jgi:hypothetical protein